MSKKTFKSEIDALQPAAIRFISEPTAQPKAETKSRRVHLLLTPTLYSALAAAAAADGRSVNEYVTQLIKTDTTKREGK